MGFCNASYIGVGGIWINPAKLVTSIMWRHSWSYYITDALILDTNLRGILTNFNLKIATLIIDKATLLEVCPEAIMAAPFSVSDNTPTVSWRTWKESTINLLVADLLLIHALHSI